MKFFYYHILFLIYSIYSHSTIRIPIKRTTPSISSIIPSTFSSFYSSSYYYSIINVGSNNEEIPLHLSFNNYHSFIVSHNYTHGDFIKYNQDASSSYKKLTFGPRYFSSLNIKQGIESKETFKFKDTNNKNTNCENINFILGIVPSVDVSGDLGLKAYEYIKEKDYNRLTNYSFITSLYKNGYIKQKVFTLNFNNKNEGEIIIGSKPSDYSNYDEDTYKNAYIPSFNEETFWGFDTVISYINKDRVSNTKEKVVLEIENNIIIPIKSYSEKIKEVFFKDLVYKSKCSFEDANETFSFYHCDKDIDISSFPILSFYQQNINYTFELNATDLFVEINDRLYFLMNFANNDEYKWVLGSPFLLKYNFTYDFDSKSVGMYFGTKEKPKEGFNMVWIAVIISAAIIVILGVVIFIVIKKFPRKTRANELKENFEYNENDGKNEEGNGDEKNKLGIND